MSEFYLNSPLLPAEWESHRATWIAWPRNAADWPGKIAAIHWVYTDFAKYVTQDEKLCILVNNPSHASEVKSRLKDSGVSLSNVEFYSFPTDRSWTRDFMPAFVKCKSHVEMVRFHFNAWAKYPNWKKDNSVPEKLPKKLKMPSTPVMEHKRKVILEGGSIDSNGKGILLTTEECLLDQKTQVRNPGFSKADYEGIFKKYLGIQQTVWLGNGIAGDDTHGHVDDLCRFVSEDAVVLCRESNPKDPNHRPLEENFERLQDTDLEVITLPMPSPLVYKGYRLPASYANFYLTNGHVLVPTFNDENDRKALGILSELFPTRKTVGIHAVDLVWGFGTLHCMTHEEPASAR